MYYYIRKLIENFKSVLILQFYFNRDEVLIVNLHRLIVFN